ncbi:YcaO-like family protein [Rhodococcus qingshengii]|uniref:YcaO-like family protein n=1 Tax=Rhodococcus qingshengii TaxID=334542 RepID=UPI0027E15F09|nr:YcaO-like family protein [Rhodococcus qingshengii]
MDDLLVDARSGVLTSLEPHIRSDMPTGWVGWAARVADTRNFGGSGSLFRADPYGFGASIRDDAAARGAATGEAVERYCGNVVPEDLVRSSASALELAGSRVVDPAEFALYSEDQYRLPGFPFVPFTSDLNIRWALGHTMDEKVPTYVPAALTYLGYYTGTRRCEPPIASLQYAGIAAGRSRDEAEMSALLELLERDATALWWCGDRSQPAIELSDWERLPAHRQLGDLESQTRSVRVLLLPSPLRHSRRRSVDPR